MLCGLKADEQVRYNAYKGRATAHNMKGIENMRTKTRKELIENGNPYIEYTSKGVLYRQIFITEEACRVRIKELEKAGCKVTRIQ